MSVVAWLIFGSIAGAAANLLDPRPEQGGLIGAVILGVLGSITGGLIANLLFGVGMTGFNFTSFSVAILGSLLLLFVGRALGTEKY